MLNFRRPRPATPRTEPAPPRKAQPGPAAPPARVEAPQASPNAEKARALLALLEQGGDPGSGAAAGAAGIAPERLRDWARDLVETVERRRSVTAPPPAAAPARGRLFTAAAPVLDLGRTTQPSDAHVPAPMGAPRVAQTPPGTWPGLDDSMAGRVAGSSPVIPQPVPGAAAMAALYGQPAPAALPVAHVAEEPMPSVGDEAPAALTRLQVRRLIEGATDPETLPREHPAIIAMTLAGRSMLAQAAALRLLPPGQVRAVRRALRRMEAG